MTGFAERLSDLLSRHAKVELSACGASVSSFHVFGLSGFVASVALGYALAAFTGLSLLAMTGVIAIAVLTFFGVALATQLSAGVERLVYYHHELAIAASTSAYVALISAPVIAHLDVTLIALAGFLAFGRIGCFMVGCCHGRAHALGVTYGDEHVRAGLSARCAGVRLFPIQLVEALLALIAVGVGSALLARGAPAGAASTWQIVWYAFGRFALEFGRGDDDRPYYFGFSQAQWISLGLLAFVTLHGAWYGLPFLGATVAMLASAIARARARSPRASKGPSGEHRYDLERLSIWPGSRQGPP